jgi:peptidoglycan/xylan/chitin deacetylase (PgdA/CDA1 family)
MRARWSLGVLAVAVMTLSACAPAPRSGWTPPTWPAAAVHTTVPAPEIDAGAAGTLARALVALRLRNDAVGVQARVALLPEGPSTGAFNAAVEQTVRGAIADRVVASGAAYTPTPSPVGAGLGDRRCVADSTVRPAPELLADPAFGPAGGSGTAVACGIVAAAGTIIGQRLRVVTGDPANVHADTSTIVYADVQTGETVTADGLWAEGAASALGIHIVEALRRGAGALGHRPASAGDEAQTAAIQAALSTTVPTSEGFVVTIAPGFSAPDLAALGVPATTEPTVITVPPTVAAALVSPFGARLLAATGQPYTGPVAAPAGTRSVDCDLVPCVAMTYDDGPSGFTPGVLDELAARDAAATFFVMGGKARGYAGTLARMTREGQQVEGHTWDHPHLPQLTPVEVAAQILDSTRAIEAASGQDVTAFRPPYGELSPQVLATAGMPAILWDVDTLDWQHPADEVLVERAVEQPRAGSIILQHDIQAVTAATVDEVLDGLLDRGFQLVTVRQLFGGDLPASGVWRRGP